MSFDTKAITAELDTILVQAQKLLNSSQYDDCSDLENSQVADIVTTLAAAIERFAPLGSLYLRQQQSALKLYGPANSRSVPILAGMLQALRNDISAGRLNTFAELLHADVFGDFLEMSQHLLDQSYKDPAAVLAGGVLEEHLRKLCDKINIPPTVGTKPKKADTMNAELAKAGAYSGLDQKAVTAWLGIRNAAAHGKYTQYSSDQVLLFIQGVRDFIARTPA